MAATSPKTPDSAPSSSASVSGPASGSGSGPASSAFSSPFTSPSPLSSPPPPSSLSSPDHYDSVYDDPCCDCCHDQRQLHRHRQHQRHRQHLVDCILFAQQPPRCHHHRPRQTEFDPAPRARTYLITAADPPDRSSSSPASSSGELSPPYPAQVYFLPARHPSPAADDAVLAKVLPRPPDFADAVETPACEPMDVDGPEFSAAVEEYNRAVSTSIPCSSSQKPGQVHVPVPDEHARMLADMDAAIDSDVARVLSLNSDTFDDVYQRERLSPLAAEREEQQNVDADEIGDLSIFGIGRLTTAFKAWNLSVSTTSPVDAEQESESEREITTATEEEKEELTSAEGATRVESMDTDGDVVMTDAVF